MSLLEITIRPLVHPNRLEDFVVRAQCRRVNLATEHLKVFPEFSHPPLLETSKPVHYNGQNKDFKEPAFSPIGTISFDSSKPLKETPFDSPEGKKLAELVAGTIFELLKILTT